MAKGHRSQIKRERNANKDNRPSAKLSYARCSVTESMLRTWMPSEVKMLKQL